MKRFLFYRMPWLPVATAPLLLFLPTMIAGKALFWGTPLLQFVPWWDLAWSQIRDGHLPLWNPYLGMGAPLMANYQSAVFYPPHWVYLILYGIGGRALMAWGMALMVALHLGWAGLGMAQLVRRLSLGWLSQVVAGLAFGLCGYLVARAGFLSINAAAAWIPWIILCLTPRSWGEQISTRQMIKLSICMGFQLLAGHAQTTWYTFWLAGMWAFYLNWSGAFHDDSNHSTDNAKKPRGRQILTLVGYPVRLLAFGVIPAVGLAAVQLLPTAEYLSFSPRAAAVDYQLAMTYSFWPWRLLGLVAPDLFGNPAQGNYWGYANFWEDAIYIGFLPFLLACGFLLAAFRRQSRQDAGSRQFWDIGEFATSRGFSCFLWFLVLLSLLLGLGNNTPLFPWLFRHVPGFDLFQAPSRHLIWMEFALCLAAAVGVENWRRPEKRGLYWTRLATVGALSVTLGAGIAWYVLGDLQPTFIRATTLMGLWGVGAGLLSLTAPVKMSAAPETKENGSWWAWAVILVVFADLFIAGYGLNPAIDLAAYRSSLIVLRLDFQRIYISPSDEQLVKFGRFLQFDSFEAAKDWFNFRFSFLPNMNLFDRISSANNFDPLVPGNYAVWMQRLDQVPTTVSTDLYRLMDIGMIGVADERLPQGIRYSPVAGGERLRWVGCAVAAADPFDALAKVTSGEVDFDSQVVLEGNHPSQEKCPIQPQAERLEMIAETPLQITIAADVPSPGYLVLSDTWYPGWRAWIDGRKAPILPANYLFRGLRLESGSHRIVMRYQPFSFYCGGLLSIISIVIIFILFISQKEKQGEDEPGSG